MVFENTRTIFGNLRSRNCSECKKLLEGKKVARNMKSFQKIAEQLVESPSPEPLMRGNGQRDQSFGDKIGILHIRELT